MLLIVCVCLLFCFQKKPSTKSFYISQELRDTERSYIADLDMLNRVKKFRLETDYSHSVA